MGTSNHTHAALFLLSIYVFLFTGRWWWPRTDSEQKHEKIPENTLETGHEVDNRHEKDGFEH
jgi:hypothetical protein